MSLITKSTYLRGPKGDIGLQGPKGDRGPQGPQGLQGPAGAAAEVTSSDNVTEGIQNLYFTNTRARTSITASGDLSYNSTTGTVSYVTPTTIASLSNHSTSDLVEGTNLYFTAQRVSDIIAQSNMDGGEY